MKVVKYCKINRRQFIGYSSAAAATTLIGGSALFELGCSSATALAEVEKFEPLVTNVLNLACVVSSGLSICGTMEQTIQNDYSTVVDLWTKYNALVAAGTATSAAWNDLNAAFNLFTQNTMEIFSLATGLNVPEITAIVAAAEVLLSTIEALFPGAPAGTTMRMAKSARFSKSTPLPTQIDKHGRATINKDSLDNWRKEYNENVDTAHHKYPSARLQKIGKVGWL
jgi:hypothetical protein